MYFNVIKKCLCVKAKTKQNNGPVTLMCTRDAPKFRRLIRQVSLVSYAKQTQVTDIHYTITSNKNAPLVVAGFALPSSLNGQLLSSNFYIPPIYFADQKKRGGGGVLAIDIEYAGVS